MSIKAKLAAAVQRANEDPKKGKYTKTITSNPQPQKPTTTNKVYDKKMMSTLKETTKTKGTMSPMPTLRPTSVSVSAEKRTDAPLAGQAPMGKTKRRG
jgi:hypothetical protein